MVGGGMISLGILAVWTSWTYFLIFHFNWNVLEIQLFQHFDTSIESIEALKFSKQFELQGQNYG